MTQQPKYHYPNILQRIGRAMDRVGMPWWAIVILSTGSVALFVFGLMNTVTEELIEDATTYQMPPP